MTINILSSARESFQLNVGSPISNYLKTTSVGKQFSNSIAAGDLPELEKLAAQDPLLTTKPLPNGELPLSYAVQQGNLPSVKFLMQKGADPSQKDDQQLSAIDYARLNQDQNLLVEMLHMVISQDVESVRAILKNPVNLKSAKKVHSGIEAQIQKLQKLGIFAQLEALVDRLEKEYHSKPSRAQSFSAYIVKELQKDPSLQMVLATHGETFLHLIIASGNKKLLETCLASGMLDLNANNIKSQSPPLYYAAVMGRVDFLQLLIRKGADFRTPDPKTLLTPLALLGLTARERDPLNINKLEVFYFLSSLAIWSMPLLTESMDIKSQLLFQYALLGTHTIATLGTLLKSYQSTKQFIGLAVLKRVILGTLPDHSSLMIKLFNGLDLAVITKRAFVGLKQCWRNIGRSPTRALLKTVVANGPLVYNIKERVSSLGINQIISAESSNSSQQFVGKVMLCLSSQNPDHCVLLASDVHDKCRPDPDAQECHDAEKSYFEWIGIPYNAPAGVMHDKCVDSSMTLGVAPKELGLEDANLAEATKKLQGYNYANPSLADAQKIKRVVALKIHPDKTNDPDKLAYLQKFNEAFEAFRACVKERDKGSHSSD